jgi:hypothetical protein
MPKRIMIFRGTILIAASLWVELLVALFKPEIFPSYLQFGSLVGAITPVLIQFAILFIVAALVSSILLSFLPFQIEAMIPSLCLFFYSAQMLARLLPQESGFSLWRVSTLLICVVMTIIAFFAMNRIKLRFWKTLIGTCFYSGISAFVLSRLFSLPIGNYFSGVVFHVVLFLVHFSIIVSAILLWFWISIASLVSSSCKCRAATS